MLRTNPSLVRRTMAGLRESGLVTSTKGRHGGWHLARSWTRFRSPRFMKRWGRPRCSRSGNRTMRRNACWSGRQMPPPFREEVCIGGGATHPARCDDRKRRDRWRRNVATIVGTPRAPAPPVDMPTGGRSGAGGRQSKGRVILSGVRSSRKVPRLFPVRPAPCSPITSFSSTSWNATGWNGRSPAGSAARASRATSFMTSSCVCGSAPRD
ncbi:Rrf2 family transcriptional regulator [Cereibacter changlensis]|uniref:Rrf2 family transcriptional regulator n=1 Tax=Cereibacter changlensis TaxID=402884 RepID=UPI001FE4F327|nr:Rrf2 family transcriptional regulator [Cereibacter changlensis]